MRFNIMKMLVAAAAAVVIAGCGRMDSAQLGERVKNEMQQELVKKTGLKGLVMESVRLIQEGPDSVEYNGTGTGSVNGRPVKFDVKCKYDGVTVLWNAELTGDSLAMLALREKSAEAVKAVKDAWPGVRDSVKSNCSAAADMAKKAYDKAAKKTGEFYDEAKGRFSSTNETVKPPAPATPVSLAPAPGESR